MDQFDSPPIAWTIAGSDSGGGAGIQADLKVFNALGVHGCSIITSVTAQNTVQVEQNESVSNEMVYAQFAALKSDLQPNAVKIGMLGSAETCKVVAAELSEMNTFIVCDPVLKSTSGSNLLSPAAKDVLIQKLFPSVSLLTPNLMEAAVLSGDQDLSITDTAMHILDLGVKSVLIKGGHGPDNKCADYWTDGVDGIWFESPRIDTTSTHGTGCVLSSAIAANIALGNNVRESVILAKTYLNQCLKTSISIGAGFGPIRLGMFKNRSEDRPLIN